MLITSTKAVIKWYKVKLAGIPLYRYLLYESIKLL